MVGGHRRSWDTQTRTRSLDLVGEAREEASQVGGFGLCLDVLLVTCRLAAHVPRCLAALAVELVLSLVLPVGWVWLWGVIPCECPSLRKTTASPLGMVDRQ
jgi:hypothetical protein